jgi:hypothetical protein
MCYVVPSSLGCVFTLKIGTVPGMVVVVVVLCSGADDLDKVP